MCGLCPPAASPGHSVSGHPANEAPGQVPGGRWSGLLAGTAGPITGFLAGPSNSLAPPSPRFSREANRSGGSSLACLEMRFASCGSPAQPTTQPPGPADITRLRKAQARSFAPRYGIAKVGKSRRRGGEAVRERAAGDAVTTGAELNAHPQFRNVGFSTPGSGRLLDVQVPS